MFPGGLLHGLFQSSTILDTFVLFFFSPHCRNKQTKNNQEYIFHMSLVFSILLIEHYKRGVHFQLY